MGESGNGQPQDVTVIIPVHNRARLLDGALRSVFTQRPGPPAEVLVIDDASEDDSAAVASRWGATVIRLAANSGPAAARDCGLAAASSPWCAFLDSDDRWTPDHLVTLLRSSRPDLGLVASSAVAATGASVRVTGNPFRASRQLRSAEDVLGPENLVTTSACMVDTATARRAGGFGLSRFAEDLDLWLCILNLRPGVLLPEITVRYTVHGSQTSGDGAAMRAAVRQLLEPSARRPVLTWRARAGILSTARWDGMRAALRDDAYRTAAGHGLRLLWPPELLWLAVMLRRRAACRRRWRQQPDRVDALLALEETVGATGLSCERITITQSSTVAAQTEPDRRRRWRSTLPRSRLPAPPGDPMAGPRS